MREAASKQVVSKAKSRSKSASKKTARRVSPKLKSTNLCPSLESTESPSVVRGSIRSQTPRSQKRAHSEDPSPDSASQTSRKRARQELAGEPIRVLITGFDTLPRHKHVSFDGKPSSRVVKLLLTPCRSFASR